MNLADKPLADITTRDIEAGRDWWPTRRRKTKTGKPVHVLGRHGGRSAVKRALKCLRYMFNWAIKKGYTDRSPFYRGGVSLVPIAKENARTRRLEGTEERDLLQHADSHLQAVIRALLQTGCRIDELRTVPITPTLTALLEMRQIAPDGKEHGPEAFVFGNEVGEPLVSVRTAWEHACRRAGITDLHIHDLRAEFASRLYKGGEPLHVISDWLGHRDVRTTYGYLRTRGVDLQQAAQRFEKAEALRVKAAKVAEKKAKARKRRTTVAQKVQTAPLGPSSAHAGYSRKLLN